MTQLQKLHKRIYVGPPGLSMMQALEHEAETTTKIHFCETLLAHMTELQERLLVKACEHYTRTFNWLPADELTGGQKTAVRNSHAADYTVELTDQLRAKKEGRLLYLYLAGEEKATAFVETWNRIHPADRMEIPDF